MTSHIISVLPRFTDFMSDEFFYKELVNSEYQTNDESTDVDENIYDLNELEEVFADHIRMGKRLQKTLYGGNLNDDMDDEDLDHPPIALTDLALKLFSKTVPNYGLDLLDMDYVSSVSEAAKISPCAMILAMIYLERLQARNSDYLESVSPPGLFVVTMLVASKFLFENEDDIVTNQLWAEALNIDVKELNHVEQNFLSAIEWRLYVNFSEYFDYLSGLEKMIAIKQSSLRGWLSYSDAYSILQDADIRRFLVACIEQVIKISVISALGYVATFLSLSMAGYVAHCRHAKNTHPSLKENIGMKSGDHFIEKPFIDLTDIDFTSSIELSDETSAENYILDKMPVKNHVYSNKNNDFNFELQKKKIANLSLKRYICSKSLSHTVLKLKPNGSYLLESSSYNIKINYPFYKLHWWSSNYKNTCIPVLVK